MSRPCLVRDVKNRDDARKAEGAEVEPSVWRREPRLASALAAAHSGKAPVLQPSRGHTECCHSHSYNLRLGQLAIPSISCTAMQASMGSAPPDVVERTSICMLAALSLWSGRESGMRLCHTQQVLAVVRCWGSCPSPDASPPDRCFVLRASNANGLSS
jgi:hypothetical protein